MLTLRFPPTIFSFENDFFLKSLLLLVAFFVPWTGLGFMQYELLIKEVSVISLLVVIIWKNLFNHEPLWLDDSGRFYLFFIIVCVVHYFVYAVSSVKVSELSFVSHVLVSSILNFSVYFIFVNARVKEVELKFFLNTMFLIFLLLAAYFIFYALLIHEVSEQLGTPYFTSQKNLGEMGFEVSYFGGMNGRSWFLLSLAAFFVGYFSSQKRYVLSLVAVSTSLAASYFMLSRGAMLFGTLLFVTLVIRTINIRQAILVLPFVIIILVLSYGLGAGFESLPALELLNEKSGFSSRDMLVFEALDLALNDFLMGAGFHSTSVGKPDFAALGYLSISESGPQNTLMSILVEVGLIGVVLYSLFWLNLYLSVGRTLRRLPNSIEGHYLSGVRDMIVWIIFSFLFIHYFEKMFVGTPIFMMICGVGGSFVVAQKIRRGQ